MRPPDELTAAFRERGLKITSQRQVLFEILHDTAEHPTAEAVHALARAQTPGISLRTVYHTLNDLVSMGEMRVVNVGGSTRFDPNVDAHQHTVCTSCGRVRDVYLPGVDDLHDDALDDFDVAERRVVFSGTCASCRDRRTTSSTHHQTNHQGEIR